MIEEKNTATTESGTQKEREKRTERRRRGDNKDLEEKMYEDSWQMFFQKFSFFWVLLLFLHSD